jgi:hypothetical protein
MWMIEQTAATFADYLQQTSCGCSCERVWISSGERGAASQQPTQYTP